MTGGARHCLLCGTRLAVVREDARTRRRCPRCGWTFYNNPVPAAVAIVEDRRGRVLLARRASPPFKGTWDLPGGFLEAGEVPERGLRREIREELGAAARGLDFLGFYDETYGRNGFPILLAVYVARLAGRPRAESDVSEVRWFARDALPLRQIRFGSVRRALRSHLAARRRRRGTRRSRGS